MDLVQESPTVESFNPGIDSDTDDDAMPVVVECDVFIEDDGDNDDDFEASDGNDNVIESGGGVKRTYDEIVQEDAQSCEESNVEPTRRPRITLVPTSKLQKSPSHPPPALIPLSAVSPPRQSPSVAPILISPSPPTSNNKPLFIPIKLRPTLAPAESSVNAVSLPNGISNWNSFQVKKI